MPESWTAEQLAERAKCIAEVCPACARGEPLHGMRTTGGGRDLLELHHKDPAPDGGCIQCPAAAIHVRARGEPPDFRGELVPCPPSRSEVYTYRALSEALRPFARAGALLAPTPAQQHEADAIALLLRHPNGGLYELSVTSGDLRRARLALADLDSRGHARSVEQILQPRGAPR